MAGMRLVGSAAVHRSIGRSIGSLLAFTACGFAIAAPAIAQAPPQDTVQLSVRINTHYADTPAKLQRLRELLAFLPPTQAELRANETLDDFVVRRYGFGPHKQPEARQSFYLIRDTIGKLNGNVVGPRTIVIPPLPRRQKLYTNPAKLTNLLPQLQSFKMVFGETITPLNPVQDRAREGSRAYIATLKLPREAVAALQNQPLFESPAVSVDNELFIADFGDTTCPKQQRTLPLLTPAEEALIRQRVASAAHRVYIFVLDTGWPNDPALQTSVALLTKALTQWRVDLNLPAVVSPAPTAVALPASLHHCVDVQESLRELSALDPNETAVKVVYVPITIQQDTTGLFRNLLEVSFVAARAGTIGHRKTDASVLFEQAKQDATNVLADISKELVNNRNAFITSQAIVDAIYRVADYIASGENTVYFINTSWGIPASLFKFTPVSDRGLTVVATGNNNEEFPGNATEFARRCVKDKTFIGAVNMDRNGNRLCCSGHIKSATFDQGAMTLGFDGIITADCGTSFAAPRLAFLLALAAAQVNTVDLSSWYLELEQRARPNPATESLSITHLLKEH